VLDELISPVATASAKHRLKVIDRITDLFAAGSRSYSYEQISLFDDVLRRLSADIEVEARAKLAQRLAGMGSAPPKLVRSLAFDAEIAVAGPVLVPSEQLTDDAQVSNVISQRPASPCDRATPETQRGRHGCSCRPRRRSGGAQCPNE
jgi:uncharacterized protein (DUF2336 family)